MHASDSRRGSVVRVDAGTFSAILWTRGRIVIDLRLHHAWGLVELIRIATFWRARWI